ncbi:MAG TPA: hypothetical protein VMK42_02080 [Anaeromyxobacteraceae bacterium]|nr:hypothetical protein [Anaeromyxobacteraceae bacterium]
MWSLEARSSTGRAIAAALYLAAVVLFVLLQEIGLRLRKAERRAWWAGNGRDVLNAVGLAAVTVSLRAYGFPLPAALVVGATITLALFGTSIFMETKAFVKRPRAWSLAVGLLFATPVLIFPARVLDLFARVASNLFSLER